MLIPLALMAAGVSQYRKYKNDQAEEIDRAADREYKSSVRNYEAGQRERTTRLQKEQDEFAVSMKNAAKPAVVEPVDIPAEGPVQPGAEPPLKQGYKVNGTVVGNEIERDKAVSAYDSPVATMRRQAGVATANGKPLEANQLLASMQQQKLGELQLDEAQQKALDTAYDRSLKEKGSTWDGLGTLISESKGDGQGGALKGKFVPSPDGKSVTFNTIGADGSMAPTPHTFTNDPQGIATAQMTLSRLTTAADKLTHLHQLAQEKQAAAQLAETTRSNQAAERQRAQSIALEGTRVELAKAAAAAEAKLPLAVKTQIASYDKELNNVSAAISKAQAEGTFNESSENAQNLLLQRKELVAKTEKLLAPYINQGKASVGGQDADPFGLFANPPADSAKPGSKAPSKPETKGKAAAAKSDSPGLLARMADNPIVKRISDLGTDYSSEAGKAALAKRVTDAGKGGPPLTEVETLRAKQAGLI